MIDVQCSDCSVLISVYPRPKETGEPQYFCGDCHMKRKARFAEKRAKIEEERAQRDITVARQRGSRIPVLAGTLTEYVRWLCKKKYSGRDYFFVDINESVRDVKSKVFVVLNDSCSRSDWKRINAYFLETHPTLIVE